MDNKKGLILNEQEFYERVLSSNKSGFSYVGKNLFVVPNDSGWNIIDSKTWKCKYSSENKEDLYNLFYKYFI